MKTLNTKYWKGQPSRTKGPLSFAVREYVLRFHNNCSGKKLTYVVFTRERNALSFCFDPFLQRASTVKGPSGGGGKSMQSTGTPSRLKDSIEKPFAHTATTASGAWGVRVSSVTTASSWCTRSVTNSPTSDATKRQLAKFWVK